MSAAKKEIKKVTTHQLQEMKADGEKIAMLTAYDYSMAKIIDSAGIDIILVGDSASNVMAGNPVQQLRYRRDMRKTLHCLITE